MKYLNLKTKQGVETVDFLDPKEWATDKMFKCELNRRMREHKSSGKNVYISQRAAKKIT